MISTHHVTALQSKVLQYAIHAWPSLEKISLYRWQFFVRVLLIACLSFSLARLFWLLFPTPVLSEANISISISNKHVGLKIFDGDTSVVNIEQLKSLQLFGKAGATQQVKSEIIIPSEETQLDLLLMGVVASNYEQQARAIIRANNTQDVYAIGAALPIGDEIILLKVMNDRVIINNKGVPEVVLLYQNDSKSTAVAANIPPSMSREEYQKKLDWEADHAEPEVVATISHPTVSLPDQAITALGRSMSNIASMNTFNEGGKMAGFKLSPGRDPDQFKALGLQSGDVVIAVNGWPMSDSGKILEMYNNLGSSASLQIKRGTTIMTVDLALQ